MLAEIFTGLKNRLVLGLEPSATGEILREIHTPKLILPAMTRNGNHVPVVVKMNHPDGIEPLHPAS